MKLRRSGSLLACIAILGMVTTSANAALIDGSISLSGGFTPVDAGSVPAGLDAATGIEFDSNASVDQGTGDFSGLPGGAVILTDFQFSSTLAPNPVDVWSAGAFTFSMNAVTVVFQNASFLLLSGTGTVSAAGFDDTPGTWELSAQTADQNTFSWSASSATVVPVPSAVWLFGSGLIGMAGIARRRKV